MPCQSDYMEPTDREKESGRVLEFLKEISGQIFDHEHPSYYGHVASLDADTARLCDWCQTHADDLERMSLELRLWWQRHERADAKRRANEEHEAERRRTADAALRKLTTEERKALGLSREMKP